MRQTKNKTVTVSTIIKVSFISVLLEQWHSDILARAGRQIEAIT